MTTGNLPPLATDSLTTANAPGRAVPCRAVTRLAVRQIRGSALLVIGLATGATALVATGAVPQSKDITLRSPRSRASDDSMRAGFGNGCGTFPSRVTTY
jgi:hypothetical protein